MGLARAGTVEHNESVSRSRWIRPLDALRALRRVWHDPDDTRAVFEVLDALDGPFLEGWFRRFRATRVGRRVLEEERDLLSILADRCWLAQMPEGSLGREYGAFVERENLSADGLVAASLDQQGLGYEQWLDDGRARFTARLRDQHDLEHVVTGYGRDLIGETALLAFDLGQSLSLGTAVLVGLGLLDATPQARRLFLEAYRRGRRGAWLPATDWEGLLELPVADVRALLAVGQPPPYEERGSDDRLAVA